MSRIVFNYKYDITIAEQTGKRGNFLEMIYQMLLHSVEAERVFSSCAYLCNRFRVDLVIQRWTIFVLLDTIAPR